MHGLPARSSNNLGSERAWHHCFKGIKSLICFACGTCEFCEQHPGSEPSKPKKAWDEIRPPMAVSFGWGTRPGLVCAVCVKLPVALRHAGGESVLSSLTLLGPGNSAARLPAPSGTKYEIEGICQETIFSISYTGLSFNGCNMGPCFLFGLQYRCLDKLPQSGEL